MSTHRHEDPDRLDPSNQSGRPYLVSGGVLILLVVLGIFVVIGAVVLA